MDTFKERLKRGEGAELLLGNLLCEKLGYHVTYLKTHDPNEFPYFIAPIIDAHGEPTASKFILPDILAARDKTPMLFEVKVKAPTDLGGFSIRKQELWHGRRFAEAFGIADYILAIYDTSIAPLEECREDAWIATGLDEEWEGLLQENGDIVFEKHDRWVFINKGHFYPLVAWFRDLDWMPTHPDAKLMEAARAISDPFKQLAFMQSHGFNTERPQFAERFRDMASRLGN